MHCTIDMQTHLLMLGRPGGAESCTCIMCIKRFYDTLTMYRVLWKDMTPVVTHATPERITDTKHTAHSSSALRPACQA